METKICSKCGLEKSLINEYFRQEKRNKDGFRGSCRICESLYRKLKYWSDIEKYAQKNKEYRAKNKEKIATTKKKYSKENSSILAIKSKTWRENNREKYLEGLTKYRKENSDKIKEQEKKYRELNKSKINQYMKKYRFENIDIIARQRKQYYKNNMETIRKSHKQWIKNNPNKCIKYTQNRNAMKKKLLYNLSEEQWEATLKIFNYQCAYCTKIHNQYEKLHQEHFIPLSHGGEYSINNIIPACKSCNSSKRDRDFFEWYPKQEFYNVKQENNILKYLNYNVNKKIN